MFVFFFFHSKVIRPESHVKLTFSVKIKMQFNSPILLVQATDNFGNVQTV